MLRVRITTVQCCATLHNSSRIGGPSSLTYLILGVDIAAFQLYCQGRHVSSGCDVNEIDMMTAVLVSHRISVYCQARGTHAVRAKDEGQVGGAKGLADECTSAMEPLRRALLYTVLDVAESLLEAMSLDVL